MAVVRNVVIAMLLVTVLAPILLYTDRFASSTNLSSDSARNEFLENVSGFTLSDDSKHLNVLPLESTSLVKEPVDIVFADNSTEDAQLNDEEDVASAKRDKANFVQDIHLLDVGDHKSTNRVLSTTNEQAGTIKLVTDGLGGENNKGYGDGGDSKSFSDSFQQQISAKSGELSSRIYKQQSQRIILPDVQVRQMKDQLIRARLFLTLPSAKSDSHLTRELRLRIREVQRALGAASKDSDLPRNANERMKAMDQTLAKSKEMQDDCAAAVKKLRAMLHSTEDQLRVHQKQTMFLTQLTAKTLPKGLHCLPLRLTNDYFALNESERQFPHQERLHDPRLFHYSLFSDNVLAASVVVNSTISNAKHPSRHVFHVVTDRLNYAAMRMWFLANPPGQASIEVRNIEDFSWLNSSYSPVLKQLSSSSMIDYYFRSHRANADPNLKYRNPKYLSILNHLRFYLPQIFPSLRKIVFLDDDIVVQKDLSGLWSIDLQGNVNGAVETCGESFHRFDRYLNFSNPLISTNFDPHACGWAYGMNVFDLEQWKRQNITEIYHSWQRKNHDRLLWKLGTLPPGLITFWKRTFPISKTWHVLGLGYNPNVNPREIGRAAVIHYNGNMKPWLEIGIHKYRALWSRYIDYDQTYLRECNINP